MSADPDKTDRDRTPTELLMKAMESFGEAEPRNVMVLWLDQNGDLCWSSTSASLCMRVGMLECAKDFMMARTRQEEGL